MSINSVTLCGRLVADPEASKVGEHQLAKFTIAVDRTYGKDKVTDFFNCEVWGKSAEYATKYLTKGSPIAINGRLKQDTWEKDGKKQSRVIVIADRLEGFGKPDTVKDNNLDGGEIKMSDIPF